MPAFDWLSRANNSGVSRRVQRAFGEGWVIPGDDSNRDRQLFVRHNVLANVIANLVGGNFFTGLLLLAGADYGFIGLMSIFIFWANLLQLLSPYILERFEKRKKLLLAMRSAFYLINIAFIGVIPLFPLASRARLTLLAIGVMTANSVAALMMPGYSVWQISHVTQRVRVPYFALVSMVNGIAIAVMNLLMSAVADAFKGAGREMLGLEALRLMALALAVVDILVLRKAREIPVTRPNRKVNLRALLTEPWKDKVYLRSAMTAFLWGAIVNMPGSFYTVYLLKDMQVSYSYINLIAVANVVVLLLMTPVWRKIFSRKSWLRPLAAAMMLFAPHYVLLAFVNRGQMALYPIAMIWSYVCLTGINLAFTCVVYINMPKENQTLYVGFYSTLANMGALAGVTLSRFFVTRLEGIRVTLLRVEMGEIQLMMLLTGFLMLCAGLTVMHIYRRNLREGKET